MADAATLRRDLAAAELAPETEVDGYRIRRLLGAGAMGRVYLAQDMTLGRWVALKFVQPELLDADSARRIVEEGRTTARFNHPHIVTVYGAGSFAGQPYLALEYVEGGTLRDRLRDGPLPAIDAARIGRAVADALAEAHRHGIVHADLKPENVLLPLDGRVRVVDFGLARIAGGVHTASSGTPPYMAPERWRGEPPTPAIDVWALGVLLHELVQGDRPLDAAALGALAYGEPATLKVDPAIPLPVRGVIERALELDPSRRPDATLVARLLSEALTPATTAAERSPFRGLEPFTEADAGDFSGRDAEVDAFVERLRREHLVLLTGPSGVGKTSFLAAGVIPRLRASRAWEVLQFRPGSAPVQRLQALVAEALGHAPPGFELSERPGALVTALRRLVSLKGASTLIVVDGFEELFTLASLEEAQRFVATLTATVGADERWRVVVSVRDDYLGQLARFDALRRHLAGLFVLGPIVGATLEDAILRPLRRVGYGVDHAELPARIARDVERQPAGLPLLQFACAALWERRDVGRRLVLARHYDELGGVGGALATHAAQLVRGLLAAELRVARALLLRLVTPEGTRRPRDEAELLEELGPLAPEILARLVSHRLVVATRDPASDRTLFELAHDSLARLWPDLARWLDETREEHALIHELEQASALWERRGRRDDETWSGAALAQTLRRVNEWTLELPSRSRAFLDAGRRRSEASAQRRRRWLAAAIASLFVLTIGSGSAAVWLREKQLEAIRQQAEIRLASGDIGRFDLVLEPFESDRASGTWERGHLTEAPRWTLTPVTAEGAPPREPYAAPELVRHGVQQDADGRWVERVEAPSREAWLSVQRPGCAPSRIRLRHLPGFAARAREPVEQLRIPVPSCAGSRAWQRDVPAGEYWRPGASPEDAETKVHVGAFAIDLVETTNARFRLFEAHVAPLSGDERVWPPEHVAYAAAREDDAPVTGIDAYTAEAWCRFLGQDLPTVDEWRKAFRGGIVLDPKGAAPNPAPRRRYPWGDLALPEAANLDGKDDYPTAAPVRRFVRDVSPYGVWDLAGNVSEWTASSASDGSFRGLRQVAGGRWDSLPSADHHGIFWVNHLPPRRFDFAVGVRCVERAP